MLLLILVCANVIINSLNGCYFVQPGSFTVLDYLFFFSESEVFPWETQKLR